MDSAFEKKTVLLGVSGGIACYKACDLIRRLTQAGAQVRCVMTKAAREFIEPLTLQTLSRNPVGTDLFDLTQESQIGHIELARAADAIVIAPATANTIAKLAHGLCDDLLSTICVASTAPLVVAPAMNVHMWRHPATQANARLLQERGVLLVAPSAGDLACGEVGEGRLAEISRVFESIGRVLTRPSLQGLRVLVTAGPTREAIDPARFLTNRSSGKMGYAIAAQAIRRGAQVTLISGPVSLAPPAGARLLRVESAREMYEAVMKELPGADVVIKSAAVSDFAAAAPSGRKLKRREGSSTIDLVPNPDILAEVGRRKEGRLVVGFAAETHDLDRYARGKLEEKNLDLLVANDVSRKDAGFDVDTNQVHLYFRDGRRETTALLSKDEAAGRVLDAVASLLPAIHREAHGLSV